MVIKNVIAVDRILSSQLVVSKSGNDKVETSDHLNWQDMKILVPARLTINHKTDGKVSITEVVLVFRTCLDQTDNGQHYCYKVTLADGEKYLIGDSERPYPVTTSSLALSDSVKDSQLNEVTVNYTKRGNLMLIS